MSQKLKDEISKAFQVIKEGGIILYPTDTIWGIGCDATNEHAVKRIYDLKKRQEEKSMLVLIDIPERIPSYVDQMPDIAWDLIEASDEPLTIIYPGAKNLAPNLVPPDQSIGIRISEDSFCRGLISKLRKPLVSTSANISGENAPENFDLISESIKTRVDYIVDWKRDDLSKKKASSIIKLGLNGAIEIIRK